MTPLSTRDPSKGMLRLMTLRKITSCKVTQVLSSNPKLSSPLPWRILQKPATPVMIMLLWTELLMATPQIRGQSRR